MWALSIGPTGQWPLWPSAQHDVKLGGDGLVVTREIAFDWPVQLQGSPLDHGLTNGNSGQQKPLIKVNISHGNTLNFSLHGNPEKQQLTEVNANIKPRSLTFSWQKKLKTDRKEFLFYKNIKCEERWPIIALKVTSEDKMTITYC